MDVTGPELRQWRENRGLSLHELGVMIGGKSGPTVSRWENGQEIPGDTQLLLRMLVHGEMPFAGIGPQKDAEKEQKNFWELQLTLEDWHVLEGLATQAGYADTKDYLLSLIQGHLKEQRGEGPATTDAASHDAVMKGALKNAAVAFVNKKQHQQGSLPESAPPAPGSAAAPSSKGEPRAKPAGKP